MTTRLPEDGINPTHFVHIFVFRDAEADRIHSESAEVKKFAAVLYPVYLVPVGSWIMSR
jgi:hypothetical protein